MIDTDSLKADIAARWGGVPAAELCLRIIDFMRDTPAAELNMLTFGTLAHAAGRTTVDEDVIAAVNILATSTLAVLEAKAMFIDDDQNEIELDMAELEEAEHTGSLPHPYTGKLISNYQRYVVPFFEPNARFAGA